MILRKRLCDLFIVGLLLFGCSVLAQKQQKLGTNSNSIHSSAVLELESTTRGLLPPRMTNSQKTSISSPASGLIVWCTDCGTNGEMQFYNGNSAWVNFCGIDSPGAPPGAVATAGIAQASVSFTAPVSNGDSAITGYTVTSSPDGFTATGGASPIIVTGLTIAASYTFTVIATNVSGSSLPSTASTAVTITCGAFVAAGVSKVFACYNLGAYDTSSDPSIPTRGNNGSYYQWGRNAPAATVTATTDALVGSWGSQGGNSNNGNWTSTAGGGPNNPCPAGFRVPSTTEWSGVLANNTMSRTTPWTAASSTNFSNAIHFGPSVSDKTLTLPAAGYRYSTGGTLLNRGGYGFFWSSTESGANAWGLTFNSSNAYTDTNDRTYGFSVRCVSE
jgi:uncharacterized protein (TIGR02145 family)